MNNEPKLPKVMRCRSVIFPRFSFDLFPASWFYSWKCPSFCSGLLGAQTSEPLGLRAVPCPPRLIIFSSVLFSACEDMALLILQFSYGGCQDFLLYFSGLRPCNIRGLRCRDVQPLGGTKTTPNRLRYPTGFVMVFSLSERSLSRHGSSPTGSPIASLRSQKKDWVPVFYPPLTVRGERGMDKKARTPKNARF